MNRNHNLDRRILVDTEKIGMHYLVLVRVALQVAQDHFLNFSIDFQVDDLGVNGFLVELVKKNIVIDANLHGLKFAPINDCWNQALVSQAAARTFP
jgi:hypothetical protein